MLFSFRLAFDRADWPECLSFRVAFGNSKWKASWKFVLKLVLLFSVLLLINLGDVLHLADFHLQPALLYR